MDFIEFSVDFIIGGIASATSIIFSNPFDVIKERMQVQDELKYNPRDKIYTGYIRTIQTGYSIAKYEGIFKLQAGLSSNLLLHCFKCGVRLGGYQWTNEKGWLTDDGGRIKFWNSVVAGGFFGVIGAYISSPMLLMKVKQHLEEGFGCKVSIGKLIKSTYKVTGIRGLWRGSSALALETLFSSAIQLTAFEVSMDYCSQNYAIFAKYYWLNTCVASIISSFIQVTLCHPLDLICTRLYNQGYDKYGNGLLYTNPFDCLQKTIKTEGIHGLYKGLVPNYWRTVPQILLTLMFWDYLLQIKHKYQQNKKEQMEAEKRRKGKKWYKRFL